MLGYGHLRRLWSTLAVVVADQATKLAVAKLTPEGFSRTVIPGFFDLVHRQNPGAAFGLFSDASPQWLSVALILFSAAAVVVLAWLLVFSLDIGARGRVGLALILGGAAGNLLDRLFRGSVIDFLDFYLGAHHWPAFNLADSAITIGGFLLIFELLSSSRRTGKAKA